MRMTIALVGLALLLPCVATAKTITVRGEGLAPCNIWIREHEAGTSRRPVQDSWILGYVNAAAGMLDVPDIEDVTTKFRNADLVAWIDDYCSSHPDDPVIRAADALMRELVRRAQ